MEKHTGYELLPKGIYSLSYPSIWFQCAHKPESGQVSPLRAGWIINGGSRVRINMLPHTFSITPKILPVSLKTV